MSDAFNQKMDDILRNKQKKVLSAVRRAANNVRNEAIKSVMSGGKGETVTRYNPRRRHAVSRAGEPPATDTGNLVKQISFTVKMEGNSAVGTVISAAPYSKPLEYGTANMAARPFLKPALDKIRPTLPKLLRSARVFAP